MKKPILQIAFVLILSLTAISYYSFSPVEIEIYGIELKKANVKEFLGEQNNVCKNDSSQPVSRYYYFNNKESYREVDSAVALDSAKQRILLIGDSMTEGIMRALKDYCEVNNHKLLSVVWVSSSISGWCKSKRLQNYVKQYSPTYVMIVLGSNELFVPNSPSREKNIKELVAQAEPAKVIWIGPPNWKPDKGLYDQLIEVLGEKRVFVSKKLSFERQKDGIHPTFKSSRYWTEAISDWIMSKSECKILLKKPDINFDSKPEVIYFNN